MYRTQEIRKSQAGSGIFFVNQREEWVVGQRYELQKMLGSGSFSSVCQAIDTFTGEKVAIKRIPDTLASPEQAKRVLREVAILRRLQHAHVIGLRDAFTRPSATGRSRYIGGELVPTSIDTYLVMEFGDGGDLFNLKGQLGAGEVRDLMRQLLEALTYLHTQSVWHRDLKSSNVLLAHVIVEDSQGRRSRKRVIKVADLGSARSAKRQGYSDVEQRPPSAEGALMAVSALQRTSIDMDAMADTPGPSDNDVHLQDLYVQTGTAGGAGACGLSSPLTRMVATPCYRAPEVVMSRGGYTSAIDIWSAGCIFGELLQRVTYVGSAATPQLQVAPLFAIHGMPRTPGEGERYGGEEAGNSITRSELHALFKVIGTPSWAEAEHVSTPAWRAYLKDLPGQAPRLHRRLGMAGEPAIHLLSRLLHFDPRDRASATEALAHEFFLGTEATFGHTGRREAVRPNLGGAPESSAALATSIQAMDIDDKRRMPRQVNCTTPAKKARFSDTLRADFDDGIGGSATSQSAMEAAVAARTSLDGAFEASAMEPLQVGEGGGVVVQAAQALAAIEMETGDVCDGSSSDTLAKLRSLLEREVMAQHSVSLTRKVPLLPPSPDMSRLGSYGRLPLFSLPNTDFNGGRLGSDQLTSEESFALQPDANSPTDAARLRVQQHNFAEMQSWDGLQEDIGAVERATMEYGHGRLANVADTGQGKLNPDEFLSRGRHGGWPQSCSGVGPKAGPSWGVSSLPPGVDISNKHFVAAIEAQQRR